MLAFLEKIVYNYSSYVYFREGGSRMEILEEQKQAMLQILKQEIINLNKEITEDTIRDASVEELTEYLELMGKIKDKLNLI